MKDRIVQYPHRYQLVPVAGQNGVYDVVPAPGTITEAGTPLNKANMLTDAVAAALGLSSSDPTVSEAINALIAVATAVKDGRMSATDKAKLDGVAAGANNYVHPTTAGNKHIPSGGAANQLLKYSAAGTAAWTTLTKSDLALGNVDDTSDANKPISTATQAALNAKAAIANGTFTGNGAASRQISVPFYPLFVFVIYKSGAVYSQSESSLKMRSLAINFVNGGSVWYSPNDICNSGGFIVTNKTNTDGYVYEWVAIA